MKKLLSVVLSAIMVCSLSVVAFADDHRVESAAESLEVVRTQVESTQAKLAVGLAKSAELVLAGTLSLPFPEMVEVQAQLDAIRTKLQVQEVRNQALVKQTEAVEPPSPRLPCSVCGGALKMWQRTDMGPVACQKYPASMGITDTSWGYYYECNSCGNLDVYFSIVCLH